jgi:phosphate transport system substrate-binding protein
MSKLLRNNWFIKIMLPVFFVFCAFSTVVQADDVVRVGGAGTGLGAMKILAEAFEKTHPKTRIKIMPSLGSAGGIKALLHGALDVAISGRPLKPEELKDGTIAQECARTPFIFVVNKNVGKNDLSYRELEMIYNGQMTKWPDGTRIRLVIRPVTDTDTVTLKGFSKEMEQAVNASNSRSNMILAVTDQEAADAVARIPGAIGVSTLTQIETEKYPLKVLSLNGIKPSLDALAKGNYPHSKSLYLVWSPKTPAAAMQFIQFIQSTAGRSILARTGTLPIAGDKKTK